MKINNPFQMNDWEIKKFLKVIFSIQLALWVLIGLDTIGLHIPILRELIGFIYLTFVPGILILRIIKLHKLSNIETILYSVGLSLFTLMFTGFFMNMVYPLFGISGPISFVPLVITIGAVVLVLCVLSYTMDKDFSDPSYIDVNEVLTPPALFLCLIPFLAIFGTYLVNFHQNNILLMLLIVVLAIIALLIGFDKFIPKNLYPLAVFVIAISLLYHSSLISMFIWGGDVNSEYYFSSSVLMKSLWDPTVPSNPGAMLSINLFYPIFSLITRLDLTWVFKVFSPFLLSIGVLGLYKTFQRQFDEKVAFLSCFFLTSVFFFYEIILWQTNQLIAQFFLVLLILLIITKNIEKIKRSLLVILFGCSLAVSHYGSSYIFMFSLISVWILLNLLKYPRIQKIMNNLYSKLGTDDNPTKNMGALSTHGTITSTFVLLFVTFTLAWYIYISSSSAFNSIIDIGDQIVSNIFTDFLNPDAAQGFNIILRPSKTLLTSLNKNIHLLTQFFITIGIFSLAIHPNKLKLDKEYKIFIYVNFAICIGAILLPHFSSAIYTPRLYFLTLFFLAPFSIIGSIFIFDFFGKILNKNNLDRGGGEEKIAIRAITIVFVLLLLFDSGWIAEVTQQNPDSFSLSQNYLNKNPISLNNTDNSTVYFYATLTPEKDVFGSKWLSVNTPEKTQVYATYFDNIVHSLGSYGGFFKYVLPLTNKKTANFNSYVFFQSINVIHGIGNNYPTEEIYELYNISDNNHLIENMGKIYSNGGVKIFYNYKK